MTDETRPTAVPKAKADREMPMAKLIQICASQNDLFGLDADGLVYQYNFNSNTWMALGREWGDRAALAGGESRSTQKAGSTEPPATRTHA